MAVDLLGDFVAAKRKPPARLRLTRPTVPEAAILDAVLKLLALHPKVSWAGRFNRGAKIVGEGKSRRYVRFNTVAGLSDVLGQLKTGRLLAIETKRKGEKPTLEQQSFIDMVNRGGGLAFVAYSTADVERELGGGV